jgi:hypothetical protein
VALGRNSASAIRARGYHGTKTCGTEDARRAGGHTHFHRIRDLGVQGAGFEPEHLAIFQSGGLCTEIKTFCILFFVNERTHTLRAALPGILNLSGSRQFLKKREKKASARRQGATTFWQAHEPVIRRNGSCRISQSILKEAPWSPVLYL